MAIQNWIVIVFFFYISRDFWGLFVTSTPPMTGNEISAIATYTTVPIVPPVGQPKENNMFVGPMGEFPTFAVGTPTVLPSPTSQMNWLRGTPVGTRQAFDVAQVNFVFSYYWPPLVAWGVRDGIDYTVNCHVDNWLYNDYGKVKGCKDITASGERWSAWELNDAYDYYYKGGLAIPYYPNTSDPLYPMGSVLSVTTPSELAGYYKVVDICPACSNFWETEGVLFLDFISDGLPNNINFWDGVHVDRVFYPNEIMPTSTLVPTSTFVPTSTLVPITSTTEFFVVPTETIAPSQ